MQRQQDRHVRDIAAHPHRVEQHRVDEPRDHHRVLVVRLEVDGPARVGREDERPFVEVKVEAAGKPEDRAAHDYSRRCDDEARLRDADLRRRHASINWVRSGAVRRTATMTNQTATAMSTGSGPSGQANSAATATTTSHACCQGRRSSRMKSQAAATRIAKSCRCQYVADIMDVSTPSVMRRARVARRLRYAAARPITITTSSMT